MDLTKSYHQIPVRQADQCKTAIITPFGLFEYRRTPFGLRNAAQSFQRMMDQILQGLPFIFCYIDDILIFSSSPDEHKRHLQQLFDRLEQHDLIVNLDKCVFAVPTIDFLGHRLSAAGIAPLADKVAAIAEYPRPNTAEEIRQFTGLINFYHRHIPRLGGILAPLYAATAGNTKKKQAITWTREMTKAFHDAKAALINATTLAHPQPDAPLALTTDASDSGAGAVLEQLVRGAWQPVAFYSKKFKPAETRYSTFDRELCSIVLAIKHFRHLLLGRDFTIFTDHKPICGAIRRISDATSPRQERHLTFISEFTSTIVHVAGKNNPVADALSRQPAQQQATDDVHPTCSACGRPGTVATVSTPTTAAPATNLPALAEAQLRDESLLRFLQHHNRDKLRLEPVGLPDNSATVWCETSSSTPRPLVPEKLRKPIFLHLHNLAHPGAKATIKLVKTRFFWPNMAKDLRTWTAACLKCQRAKVHRHIKPAVQFIDVPADRFDEINVDIVGPLPVSEGHTHLLTIMDRFTRWPEAIPLRDTSAATCCTALLHHWIARFGVPRKITSDRGAQFTSALWRQMSNTLGIQLNHTTAYHPQSNGLVERFHRHLKAALVARTDPDNWYQQLPWVMLAIRNTVKDDLNTSPAALVYGTTLTLPGDVLPVHPALPHLDRLQQLHEQFAATQPCQTRHHRKPEPSHPLPVNTRYVFVRRDMHRTPLTPAYEGPFKVVALRDTNVVIQRGLAEDTIAAERCKPAVVESDDQLAVPPRRGRPPAAATWTQPAQVFLPLVPDPTPSPLPTRPPSPESPQAPARPPPDRPAAADLPPVRPAMDGQADTDNSCRPRRPRNAPPRFTDFIME